MRRFTYHSQQSGAVRKGNLNELNSYVSKKEKIGYLPLSEYQTDTRAPASAHFHLIGSMRAALLKFYPSRKKMAINVQTSQEQTCSRRHASVSTISFFQYLSSICGLQFLNVGCRG